MLEGWEEMYLYLERDGRGVMYLVFSNSSLPNYNHKYQLGGTWGGELTRPIRRHKIPPIRELDLGIKFIGQRGRSLLSFLSSDPLDSRIDMIIFHLRQR